MKFTKKNTIHFIVQYYLDVKNSNTAKYLVVVLHYTIESASVRLCACASHIGRSSGQRSPAFSRLSGQWNRCGGRDSSAKKLETGAVEILMASDTFVNDVIICISFGISCIVPHPQ